jgi:hypothetical protein
MSTQRPSTGAKPDRTYAPAGSSARKVGAVSKKVLASGILALALLAGQLANCSPATASTSDFVVARAYWAEAAGAPAYLTGLLQLDALKYLAAGRDAANATAYDKAIALLHGVAEEPETGISVGQLDTAERQQRELGGFFGTPGLYLTSRLWPKASPLVYVGTCNPPGPLLALWGETVAPKTFAITITFEHGRFQCGGLDGGHFVAYGPKMTAPLAVDAPVFDLGEYTGAPVQENDYYLCMDLDFAGAPFTFTVSHRTFTALSEVYEP